MGWHVTRELRREVNGKVLFGAGWRSVLHGLVWMALLASLQPCPARADERSPLERYPGRMVSIGTHALHIDCAGQGGPVLVLESGIGGFSLEWHAVKSALSRHHRVCAYDRAGYGWSDAGPGPRTAERNAQELAALLAAAGEPPPYVLAGHSYGGYIVRLFAERHPARVAGLVLVDAAAPEQFARLPDGALPRAWAGALAAGARVFSMPRPAAGFPPESATLGLQLMMLPKARAAYASEVRWFEASAARVARQGADALPVPLVVLSRARREFDAAAGGADAERVWREMQAAMRRLSPYSDHWIAAGAGHQVHADRPDLVALALEQVTAGGTLLVRRGGESTGEDGGFARLVLVAPPPSTLATASWARF